MNRFPRIGLLLCMVAGPLAFAASTAGPAERPRVLDEVVVEATHGKLAEMRQEMVKSEERFFERYDTLNTNDDFDVHCAEEARVGTLMKRRYCRAVYHDKALEVEGHDHLQARKAMDPGGGFVHPWAPPPPALMGIEARASEFRKNMLEVAGKDQELVRLLRERYELGKRYEAAHRKIYGRRPQGDEAELAPAALSSPR